MMTEIKWINHAGYELQAGGLRIVHDPWMSGLAFDDGWALVSETVYPIGDFERVDYIWFSHEHPDHFSPPALRQIPEQVRKGITVLFQETRDKRVIEFCRKLGFKTQELPNGKRIQLNDQVAVTNGRVLGRDSWLFTETPNGTIFNANDCVGVDWNRIASSLSRPVDLLLTQFSYANWVGNPGDHSRMKAAAEEKLREMRHQMEVFRPRTVIPFASFVWFCREENFHMNEHMNRIGDVFEFVSRETNAVVLYPGDRYQLGQPHDSRTAIKAYTADFARLDRPLDVPATSVPLAEIENLSKQEQVRLVRKNSLWMLRPLHWVRKIRPVSIYLSDIEEGIVYSMFGGIVETGVVRDRCELICDSRSFANMLKSGYGYSTLAINGRYFEAVPGAMKRLSRHFAIAARNEEGINIPGILFQSEYVKFQLKRAIGVL